MTVEDAEVKFGNRWNQWTEEEEKTFVADMSAAQMRNPLCLRLAVKHSANQPAEVKAALVRVMLSKGE